MSQSSLAKTARNLDRCGQAEFSPPRLQLGLSGLIAPYGSNPLLCGGGFGFSESITQMTMRNFELGESITQMAMRNFGLGESITQMAMRNFGLS